MKANMASPYLCCAGAPSLGLGHPCSCGVLDHADLARSHHSGAAQTRLDGQLNPGERLLVVSLCFGGQVVQIWKGKMRKTTLTQGSVCPSRGCALLDSNGL